MARLNDISAQLAHHDSLSQTDAETFVNAYFSLIAESLPKERLVRVRGLGAFKVVAVKARESVSVQTGERLVIGSHDKISFQPDPQLRDQVNKPFAAFQTVVINDGVDFRAIDAALTTPQPAQPDPTEPEPAAPEEQKPEPAKPARPKQPEPETKPEQGQPEPTSEPAEPQPEQPQPAPAQETAISASPIKPINPIPPQESQAPQEPPITREDLNTLLRENRRHTICWIACAVVAAIVVGTAGFLLGRQMTLYSQRPATAVAAPAPQKAETATQKAAPAKPKASQPKPKSTATPQHTQQKAEGAQQKPEPQQPAYGHDDPEVRHGAYIIEGIDRTVRVHSGQTMASISRANYGPGMECYVKAVNPGTTEVKPGDKLNLPKLRLKRRR